MQFKVINLFVYFIFFLKIVSGTSTGENSDSAAPSVMIEYFGGTVCDIPENLVDYDSVSRSTTVEIFCGKSDQIIEIQEDRTCHYYIKISSTVLCLLPGYVPKEAKYKKIAFYPTSTPADTSIETQ